MKLINILSQSQHPLYKIMTFYENQDYYYPFAKVIHKQTTLIEEDLPKINGLGVYVDIFPVDGLPSNDKRRHRHFRKLLFL